MADWVVITGAAGAIGSEVAREFLSRGYVVVGLDRDEVAEDHDQFTSIQVDLLNQHEVEAGFRRAATQGPLVHVLGIAGGALPEEISKDVTELSLELFEASVRANLTSQFVLLRAALPVLRAHADHRRSITFVSSISALASYGLPAYSAAKAGLIGLMHAIAGPLAREGIRTNVVALGTVQTPAAAARHRADPTHYERMISGTASGRLTTAGEAARAILSTATIPQLVGQIIVVDGGQMVWRG
jgi:NAD(P)-dependent dehydrogenase (short-subunit alcohol dehydrogenase family)